MRCRGGNMEDDYGYLEIRLDGLLKEKGLSKNKLSHKAEMNWKQIDNYCTNSITRLDVYVLCKLCTVLECEIQDLLVFHPRERDNSAIACYMNHVNMLFIKLAPAVRELEKNEWNKGDRNGFE